MGDVSFSLLDFGFPRVRNYFETSHAKGPQDSAGANLIHKADMAVIRCEVVIQKPKTYSILQKPTLVYHPRHNSSLKLSSLRDVYSFMNPSMTETDHVACLTH